MVQLQAYQRKQHIYSTEHFQINVASKEAVSGQKI